MNCNCVKMTKSNQNIQLIPATLLYRDGPTVAERTNDIGGVSVELHDQPEAESVLESDSVTALCTTEVASEQLDVETVVAPADPSPVVPKLSAQYDSPSHITDVRTKTARAGAEVDEASGNGRANAPNVDYEEGCAGGEREEGEMTESKAGEVASSDIDYNSMVLVLDDDATAGYADD